ncbi:molybdopterin-guanine dinucleotide biosynthesis protein B [Ferroacidibacillus organovorans]|uniref:molybdopterin-guanine dinucleotide biosynthesis protein B n=1 Tax=Ferroacidibacillus organovorans TaxID=1765683 RepID=UPI0015C4B0B2|nr:molybdopterin-guanine dinucleotide biosynthesis protein B [Ferroacidibacillus organovorans]
MKKPFVLGVAGYKNTGKTTLICRLLDALHAQGFVCSVIKHDAHGFTASPQTSDTGRYFSTGAASVVIASPDGHMALERTYDSEPPLTELLGQLAPSDVVLVEGFKRAPMQKLVMIEEMAFDAHREAFIAPDFVDQIVDPSHIRGYLVPALPLRVAGLNRPVYHRDEIDRLHFEVMRWITEEAYGV